MHSFMGGERASHLLSGDLLSLFPLGRCAIGGRRKWAGRLLATSGSGMGTLGSPVYHGHAWTRPDPTWIQKSNERPLHEAALSSTELKLGVHVSVFAMKSNGCFNTFEHSCFSTFQPIAHPPRPLSFLIIVAPTCAHIGIINVDFLNKCG